ncbi:MAG: Endothelin-converting enzyme, partial [Bacteroidota bacterium]
MIFQQTLLYLAMKKPILLLIGLFVTTNLMAQSPEKFIDKANMNLSVKPGDDFFEYANGIWIKNNPIPAKETRWGSFNELREFNSNAVKTILEEALKNIDQYEEGSVEKRVADFYAAGMDTLTIEKRGFEPIKKYLAEVDAIKDLKGVVNEIA